MTLTTMMQELDEGHRRKKEVGQPSGTRSMEEFVEDSLRSSSTGHPEGTGVDQPSVDVSSNRPGYAEFSSSVPDNVSRRRDIRDNSDDNPGNSNDDSEELSRTIVSKEFEHQKHKDNRVKRRRRANHKWKRDVGGRSAVREDRRKLALGEQVANEFDALKVDPKDLPTYWPFVLSGIEYVIEKTNPNFVPEDVYNYCARGEAWLIVTYTKKKEYAGFVVVAQSALDNFSSKPELLLWVAYSKIPGAAKSTVAKLEILAKKLGFGYIVFHSPRKGWVRHAESMGFSLRERVYHKKL